MTGSSKPIIRFEHATFGFPGVIALKEISLAVNAGEFIGVIGPNGSGKTTLCKAVLGLMAPLEGSLKIFDCACEELRCHHRAKIGYLPQKGVVDRNFPVTVLETVMMGRYGTLGLFTRPPIRRTTAEGFHRQSVGPATTSIVARRADDRPGYHNSTQCCRVGTAP